MKFRRPDKLTLAIFSLPFFSLAASFVWEFLGSKELPALLAYPLALLNFISVIPPFFIFGVFLGVLGIDIGDTIGFYGSPDPNLLGWALILLTDGIIYYTVASTISEETKNRREREVIFYVIVSLVVVAYAYLFLFSRSN